MELKHINRIAYLLSRRFADILSEEEDAELERWLAADERNRLFWKEIHRLNFYSEKEIQEHLYHEVPAFEKVQARHHRHVFRRRMLKISVGVAAVITLAVGISLVKINFPHQSERLPPAVAQLPAGESRAVLILGDGRRIELTAQMEDTVMIGTGIRLAATGETVEYPQEAAANQEITYNILEVPRKGEFRMVLSDGTKVWINSESRIKYPVAFAGNERRVYLEGEAYFEVAKNKSMPFIVDMQRASIRVLGTSFNARAYRDEANIYATLTEGQIQLNSGKQNLTLRPEEQGVVNLASGNLTRRKVELNLYTGWKDGRFIFQEQTLGEIMNSLARWYDIRVVFENDTLKEVTFTGNLKRYEGFDKIIEMLEMTGMAHFKVDGNTIRVIK